MNLLIRSTASRSPSPASRTTRSKSSGSNPNGPLFPIPVLLVLKATGSPASEGTLIQVVSSVRPGAEVRHGPCVPSPPAVCCNAQMTDAVADKEAIEQVKYRYLRALDTKDWDAFAGTLTDDVTGDYVRSSLGPGVITEHRVTHPEITIDADEANAVWYLQDRVIAAEFNFMLI